MHQTSTSPSWPWSPTSWWQDSALASRRGEDAGSEGVIKEELRMGYVTKMLLYFIGQEKSCKSNFLSWSLACNI